MKQVNIYKAQRLIVSGDEVESVSIHIEKETPDMTRRSLDSGNEGYAERS